MKGADLAPSRSLGKICGSGERDSMPRFPLPKQRAANGIWGGGFQVGITAKIHASGWFPKRNTQGTKQEFSLRKTTLWDVSLREEKQSFSDL